METVQENKIQTREENPPKPDAIPAPPLAPVRTTFVSDVLEMRRSGAYILPTLLPRIKRSIDNYLRVPRSSPTFAKRWPSCAVVGNSGMLIEAGYGQDINAHASVWRINLSPTVGFERHVGDHTTVSFINGHRINWCAKQEVWATRL